MTDPAPRPASWRNCFRVEKLLEPPLPPNVDFPDFWSRSPLLSRRSRGRQLYRSLMFRAVYIIGRLTFSLGLARAARFARFVGRLGYYFLGEARKTTLENLRASFGSTLSERERKRIAKAVFSGFTISAVETMWMSRWKELFSWLEIEMEGVEHMEDALDQGHGVIGLCAHFGSWEVFASSCGKMGMPTSAVSRQQKDPRLEEWIGAIRANSGLKMITRGKNPVQMLRCLRRGELLALLIDLDTRSAEGIFVDFFGRPAYTPIGPFLLARRTGARIIHGLCYREGLNRLRFRFSESWEVPRTEDEQADIRAAAERASKYLEECIRQHPEQWAWFHKRWKTTPERIRSRSKQPFNSDEDSPG